MVGVNEFTTGEGDDIPTLKIDEAVQKQQLEALAKVKAGRSQGDVKRALDDGARRSQGRRQL